MVTQIYHSQLRRILDQVYTVRKSVAVMLLGTFGIGKSYAVREFAKNKAKELGLTYSEETEDVNDETKFCCLVFALHQYEPGDLKGIPFPDKERQSTIYLREKRLPIKGKGVIFLDEINSTHDMIRKNAYQLIEDRRIGNYVVPEGYMIVGAGNKASDRSNIYEMEMALNNRFLWAELLTPPVDDIEIEENGQKVTVKGWINDFAIQSGVDHRIQNYLRLNKTHLFTFNPEQVDPDPTQGSPRIWTKISDMISNIPDNDYWSLETYVSMGVGTGIGASFVAWLKLSSKYDIAKIFKEVKVTIPTEVSLKYSLISGLIGHYLENKNAERAVALAKLSMLFSREHTLMILNQVKYADPSFFKNVKAGDPKLYAKMADELFKFLI